MSEHKHTPGPWTVGFDQDTTWDDTIPICSQTESGGEMVVACVWPIETEVADESDISRANAHLIAASPKMLAALEKALANLEWAESAIDVEGYVDDWQRDMATIRAVIAEAKGGA